MENKNLKFGLFGFFEDFKNNKFSAFFDQMELIKLAENIGLDEVYITEHHFNDYTMCPNPSILLSYICAITKKIKIGTAGYLAPFHDPIRLAEDIAVLDILSKGRINLGFAKGAFAPDSKHFKVEPQDLRDAMFETIEAIEGLLNGSIKDYNKEFINFSNVDIEPKPFSSKIPFYIATTTKQSIEYAAKNNYGLMFSPGASLDEIEKMLEVYKQKSEYKPRIVIARKFYMDEDKNKAQNEAKISIDHFAKSMKAASSYKKAPTFDIEKYKQLVEQREAFFDGEVFYNNGIIGDIKSCKTKIKQIEQRFDKVTILLKPLGRDYPSNAKILNLLKGYIL